MHGTRARQSRCFCKSVGEDSESMRSSAGAPEDVDALGRLLRDSC